MNKVTFMVEYNDIILAHERIRGIINKTPIMTSRTLNKLLKAEIYLKCENFQRVGAFKMRGAYNAISLLSKEQKNKGIIAHSSGNHAQAVALSAKLLGIKATIVMPVTSQKVKINATKDTIIMIPTSFVTILFIEIMMDLTGMNDIVPALLLNLLLWIGFVATVAINQVNFNDRGLKLFLLEYGFYLIGFLIAGLILSAWP